MVVTKRVIYGKTIKTMKISRLFVTCALLLTVLSASAAEYVNGLWVSPTPGTDFDESTVWYQFSNYKSGGTIFYISTGAAYTDTDYVLKLSNTTKDTTDSGLWCIVSDGNGAYRFYNKALGTGYVLSTANSSKAAMVASASAKSTSFTFQQGKNGAGVSGWFIKDGTSGTNYWNQQSGYIAHWNSSGAVGDNNSTFIFTPAGDEPISPSAEYSKVNGGTRPTGISPLSLWYDFPSTHAGVENPWMEYGLPIGNGQIGATLLGGVRQDEIILNEKTLYNGSPTDWGEHGTYACLGKIMVDDLSEMASVKDDTKPINDYVRYLDIEQGVAGVNFSSSAGTHFTHRYLVSAPHRILACNYKAEGSESLHLRFSYEPDGSINASSVTYKECTATFGGKLKSVSYSTEMRIVATGGTVTTTAEGIEVDDANEVTLFMTAATNFDDSTPSFVKGTRAQVAAANSQLLDAACADGWKTVWEKHTAQFSELMGRVSLQLGDAASTMTTKALVDNYAKAANRTKADGLFLEQLYFQYGRYLEVSCNNVLINAPANLQGIWNNDSNTSFWHCDIHTDVNVQMNYWPAEITNLSTMHLPFLNNIITLAKDNYNYHRVAQRYKNGVRGWMVPTETNIFGGTSTWMWDKIKTLAAWNCSHLWQHYRYTLDRDFLARALPAMLKSAQFLKDISTKASNGTWFVADEYSPEHGPTGHSTAFAQQNTAEVVRSVIEGAEVLGADSPISEADLQEMRDFWEVLDRGLHIETYNGKACLREWADLSLDSQGDAASHRHLSHLMALYPYGQVSAFASDAEGKRLYQAAVNSLMVRNATDVTGWSGGWKVNLYARALKGDEARKVFALMLKHSQSYVIAMSGQGGCYYNLWDAHSPFQIDGNFGFTSGVAEMLLQSYDGNLHLLPAIPTAWKSGSIKGLKAVGDFTVDQEWADKSFVSARIINNQGQPLTLTIGLLPVNKTIVATVNGNKVEVTTNRDGSFTIPTTTAGDIICLTLAQIQDAITPATAVPMPSSNSYNLCGIRVNPTQHSGIYIINGKKIAVY